MGLTSAMYTGLSGLNVNQSRIDTIGNNIANVNTTAFKASRTLFQTQFSQLLSAGNGPSQTSGGVNPTQIGLGSMLGATSRNFGSGSIETTGVPSDLAVSGKGLFIVNLPGGQQAYTRDGSFAVDSANRLVTSYGASVRGFGVDSNFQIVPGNLTDLTIPLGTQIVARPTQNVAMTGQLSANSSLATQGSSSVSQALVDGGGAPASGSTSLTDLRSATDPGTVLFSGGSVITVSGVEKGGRELPAATFTVGQDGATLSDFASWLNDKLGIQTTTGLPGTPGATVQNGTLVINSNAGEGNGIEISANDFSSDAAAVPLPLQFTQAQDASGSSVYTSMTVYDSLGTPVNVNVTYTLDSTGPTGPVWRYYVESADSQGAARALGSGTVSFDTQGNYLGVDGNQFTIDRSGTGAASPLGFAIDMSQLNGLATDSSAVIMQQQDGFPPGELVNYGIGNDGTITGVFSNGLSRTLGQVALAVFPNDEGLIAGPSNLYESGPNSGTPNVAAPGQFGSGSILSGALELSNVDLSNEFIGLITSSTGFQAASRIISTSSDMLDQLLLITR